MIPLHLTPSLSDIPKGWQCVISIPLDVQYLSFPMADGDYYGPIEADFIFYRLCRGQCGRNLFFTASEDQVIQQRSKHLL